MILPSESEQDAPPASPSRGWSSDHLRLHRLLRRRPELLPPGSAVLLAVSGGQDSMAMTALLQDLARLHHWRLHLWHGDHGWRPDSARQAQELAEWAGARGLEVHVERAAALPPGEAAARHWRYARLAHWAARLGCSRVATAHTATDRAETLLLHLARGSHRRGLASLRSLRPLEEGEAQKGVPLLIRPLLLFSREDTARLCRDLALPVWLDSSNADPRLARNRIRLELLPVLEELHPGATRRIAAQAQRLAEELEPEEELIRLALAGAERDPRSLERPRLMALHPANQRRLLQAWLRRHGCGGLSSEALEILLGRLRPGQAPGRMDLAGGWRLCWDRSTLALAGPPSSPPLHD
ncbi:MAG: tRNA lysidine(34) synthetase TilS [Prochlorococcaceae cyanobacterium]